MPAFSDGIAMCQVCDALHHKMEGGIRGKIYHHWGSIWQRTRFSCIERRLTELSYFAKSCRACSFASLWRISRHVSWRWRHAPAPIIGLARWFSLASAEADCTSVCQGVHQAAEERRSGCGGDRRGSATANDALRRNQNRGAAVSVYNVSHARTVGQSPH